MARRSTWPNDFGYLTSHEGPARALPANEERSSSTSRQPKTPKRMVESAEGNYIISDQLSDSMNGRPTVAHHAISDLQNISDSGWMGLPNVPLTKR